MGSFGRLEPALQEKIVHNLGWTTLRPVQDMTIEAVLDGNNCVVLAPTAGGKTEASIFPVLSGCLANQEPGVRALYICPTKALLNNQEERLSRYAEMVGLKAFKWHGDVKPSAKSAFIREPSELLLTTPESLEVMLVSAKSPTAKLFKHLKYVVVDEIHALAACDRGNHLISVLERLRPYSKNDFQRLGLSATVGNPGEILTWLQGSSENPSVLVDPPKKVSRKQIEIRWTPDSGELTSQAISLAHGKKSLLFCESRRLVETISRGLKQWGDYVYVHHSSLSTEERENSEEQFQHGTQACIVCTSTMELGIDVGDLDRVLQVNCPNTVSSFMQRLGRTGRRETTVANTTFFIEKEARLLQAIALVELAKTGWIENVSTNRSAWHILLHQIMAMCLERGAVTPDMLWVTLHGTYCFSGIGREKFDRFVRFLLDHDLLHDDGGGSYSMGLAAEKAFGRRNFMEIYSVFSSPVEFDVIRLAGDIIGTVQWDFLEKLLEENASFYLAGKAWMIERIEWKHKRVYVVPAPGGKVPKWGGISPNFLGYEVCRRMRDCIAGQEDFSYLDVDSRDILNDIRQDRGAFLSGSFAPIEYDSDGITWWTYAGGSINNTLRAVFTMDLQAHVQAGNEFLRAKHDLLKSTDYDAFIWKISGEDYWKDPETLKMLLSAVPNYHLSKFQPYLPEELKLRLVADTVYDVEGTLKFLSEAAGTAKDTLSVD